VIFLVSVADILTRPEESVGAMGRPPPPCGALMVSLSHRGLREHREEIPEWERDQLSTLFSQLSSPCARCAPWLSPIATPGAHASGSVNVTHAASSFRCFPSFPWLLSLATSSASPRLRVNQPESSRGDAENTEKRSRMRKRSTLDSQLSSLFSVCPACSVVTLYRHSGR
jgi:hypothetical protein